MPAAYAARDRSRLTTDQPAVAAAVRERREFHFAAPFQLST